MNLTPGTDAMLRLMRDTLYPAQCQNQIQSDESWDHVKAKWRADEQWLKDEYEKEISKLSRAGFYKRKLDTKL